MRTSSCKAKGRRACAEAKDLMMSYAPDLREGDIEITSSGAPGRDLKLSPTAREKFNYAIEIKNVEKLNVSQAFKQACTHVKFDGEIPLLIHTKNRSEMLVTLRFEDFLKATC